MRICFFMCFETVNTFGHTHRVDGGQRTASGLMHGCFTQCVSARKGLQFGRRVAYVSHGLTLAETGKFANCWIIRVMIFELKRLSTILSACRCGQLKRLNDFHATHADESPAMLKRL